MSHVEVRHHLVGDNKTAGWVLVFEPEHIYAERPVALYATKGAAQAKADAWNAIPGAVAEAVRNIKEGADVPR